MHGSMVAFACIANLIAQGANRPQEPKTWVLHGKARVSAVGLIAPIDLSLSVVTLTTADAGKVVALRGDRERPGHIYISPDSSSVRRIVVQKGQRVLLRNKMPGLSVDIRGLPLSHSYFFKFTPRRIKGPAAEPIHMTDMPGFQLIGGSNKLSGIRTGVLDSGQFVLWTASESGTFSLTPFHKGDKSGQVHVDVFEHAGAMAARSDGSFGFRIDSSVQEAMLVVRHPLLGRFERRVTKGSDGFVDVPFGVPDRLLTDDEKKKRSGR